MALIPGCPTTFLSNHLINALLWSRTRSSIPSLSLRPVLLLLVRTTVVRTRNQPNVPQKHSCLSLFIVVDDYLDFIDHFVFFFLVAVEFAILLKAIDACKCLKWCPVKSMDYSGLQPFGIPAVEADLNSGTLVKLLRFRLVCVPQLPSFVNTKQSPHNLAMNQHWYSRQNRVKVRLFA